MMSSFTKKAKLQVALEKLRKEIETLEYLSLDLSCHIPSIDDMVQFAKHLAKLKKTLKFLSKGTLKSTRIITFLPLVHISLIFFIMQT